MGIETSCDETAAAVVKDGHVLLSNVVASSMDLHVKYGGVVPEIAARSQIESITPVINQALFEARYGQGFGLDVVQGNNEKRTRRTGGTVNESRKQLTQQYANSISEMAGFASQQADAPDDLWGDVDGIAVTYGAGLGGSLLVGVLAARTLAIINNKPLYAVNHVEGHVYANFLTDTKIDGLSLPVHQPKFPMLALIVSGGHTQLALFKDHFDYKLLGQTHDDAIGEAFDKVAKILGLPYPGGPSIAAVSSSGNPSTFAFPKAKMSGKYDFSFSGLKTAVLRETQKLHGKKHDYPSHKLSELLNDAQRADLAASFQKTAIEMVTDKTLQAYKEFNPASVVIAGGVAANMELRRQLMARLPINIEYTDPKLCTDNGAMIATLGCYKDKLGQPTSDPYTLDIKPNLGM